MLCESENRTKDEPPGGAKGGVRHKMYHQFSILTGALVPSTIFAHTGQETRQRSSPLRLAHALLYAAGAALAITIAAGLFLWWWLTRRSDRESFRQGIGTSPRAEIRLPAKVRTPEPAPAPPSAIEMPTARPEPAPPAPDDLQRIRGIGPKIAGLLQLAGIQTYAQLAMAGVDRLREILADEGLARLADPTSWPEQARLAAEGEWGALEALQVELRGRR
jgi:predicted flap endonuclease-1-like 5' DNA nuclease